MASYSVNFKLRSDERSKMRKSLIKAMLDEKPGTGKGANASRYQYNVEQFKQYTIFLKRPTQLNKGFDFTVNVGGLWFKKARKYTNPSHDDIIAALSFAKNKNPRKYSTVKKALVDIYNCKDPDFSKPMGICFLDYEGKEHPIEIIILAVKWLFMEQDCAYWNYSGREMFYTALKDNGLV